MERYIVNNPIMSICGLHNSLKPLNQLYVKYQHRRGHLKDGEIPETSI